MTAAEQPATPADVFRFIADGIDAGLPVPMTPVWRGWRGGVWSAVAYTDETPVGGAS